MQATHSDSPAKGLIATFVEALVPIVALLERLGLRGAAKTATSYAIRAYQTHLSPRKGFSCAHRRLYGEVSCSEYFRQTVLSQGFTAAVPLFQRRLDECRRANLSLRSAMQSEPEPGSKPEWMTDWAALEATEKAKRKPKNSPCDGGNCDCGSGDCSSCDFPCVSFSGCDRNHNGAIDPGDLGGCDLTPGCDWTPDCGGADLGGCGDIGGCDIGGCDVGGCDCSW